MDFLQYLRKQEKILHKLINASSIDYLENEKELGTYYTESIINITIGIKKQHKTKPISNKTKGEDLHEILRTKEQQLQSLRTMMPGLSANGADADTIRDKKKEMNKLKKDIEELQYEIQKQKLSKYHIHSTKKTAFRPFFYIYSSIILQLSASSL